MKTLFIIAIIASFFVSVFYISNNNAEASCIGNNDWSDAPCYDEFPQPSIEEKKKDWQKYYELKGKEWMEMKKTEMFDADKNRILKEWHEYGIESNNMPNFNVWYYYNLYGEAPDIKPYYDGVIVKDELKPIITYYYISMGAIVLIGIITSIIGVAGFFSIRKLLSKSRGS